MKKPSIIEWAEPSIKRAYYELKKRKETLRLYNAISKALDDLEKNAFFDTQIPKKLIPRIYIQKYGLDNLWKYDLPGGWRLLYSIKGSKVVVLSIIIEWMDHKNYERRFGY